MNAQGYAPDPDRLRSITQAPLPSSKEELRSLMGYLQFYSRLPNFATLSEPLFKLQISSNFQWTKEYTTLELLRGKLSQRPVLRAFSLRLTPTITTDASPYAIGAIMEQDGHPVIFVFRKLSTAERGYTQTQNLSNFQTS